MSETPRRWGGSRVWVPAAALLAALVVTLAVIALQSPTEYDPSTPEGAAQGYVRAIVAGEQRAALEYVDASLGCTVADLRFAWVPPSVSVRLVGTHVAGATAEVDLSIAETGAPFGAGYAYPATIAMERRGDAWVIVETPWPMYHCEGEVGG